MSVSSAVALAVSHMRPTVAFIFLTESFGTNRAAELVSP